MSITRAYFHEDDYCQIEILPAQNWEHCANELGKISEFSEQHKAQDGVGWTAMYMRGESPRTLSSLRINFELFSAALAQHLPMFGRVETGYSSHVEECPDTRAYGFEGACIVFVASDEEKNTANVWLTINELSESQQKSLIAAFRSIEDIEELLFVDWGWGSLFFLHDQASSQHYLQERTERMKAFQKKWLEERSSKNEKPKAPWWRFWG